MKSVLLTATAVFALSLGSTQAASPSAPLTITVTPGGGSTTCTTAPCPGSILPAGTSGWVVGFDDEFTGTTLNTNNWVIHGEGGWPNDCTRYLSVNNGLTLQDTKPADGTACALDSVHIFGFGYYEVNMLNDPVGLSEFWTESNGNNGCNPIDSGFEADIYETVGNSQNLYWGGYAGQGGCGYGWHTASNGHLPGADGNYHLYGMDFESTGITFYADGVQTGNYSHTFSSSGQGEWLILSNLFQGSTPDPGMKVKWVRVYHH